MERVNLHEFYELGRSLHPLTDLKSESTKLDLFVQTSRVIMTLKQLAKGNPVELRNNEPIKILIDTLEHALREDSKEPERSMDPENWFEQPVDKHTMQDIAHRAKNLEVILANEFPLFHSYLISEEGLESVDTLIQNPQIAFSQGIIDRLKSCDEKPLDDFKESARCLAFGFWKACGFHVVPRGRSSIKRVASEGKPKSCQQYVMAKAY